MKEIIRKKMGKILCFPKILIAPGLVLGAPRAPKQNISTFF